MGVSLFGRNCVMKNRIKCVTGWPKLTLVILRWTWICAHGNPTNSCWNTSVRTEGVPCIMLLKWLMKIKNFRKISQTDKLGRITVINTWQGFILYENIQNRGQAGRSPSLWTAQHNRPYQTLKNTPFTTKDMGKTDYALFCGCTWNLTIVQDTVKVNVDLQVGLCVHMLRG